MKIDSYGVSQICLNGHILTDQCNDEVLTQKCCSRCGEAIINRCQQCQVPIKGRPRIVSQIDPPFTYFNGPEYLPAFCINCGSPYPWTQRAKESIQELIEFSDNLNATEKGDFIEILPALVVDTPKSPVAIIKCKTYITKVGGEIAKGIKDILKELATEAVKKALWP